MNKKLIAILTLVMFAITLLPMGAFAATTNSALQIKTVGTTATERVGDLRVAETDATKGSIKATDTITFSLLNGAKFASSGTITTGTHFNNVGNIVSFSETSITVDTLTVNPAQIDFLLSKTDLDLTSLTGDEVIVDVYSPQGGVSNGKVTVATVASGETKATVLSTKTFSVGKTNQSTGTLRIIETKAGALDSGTTKKINISIPTTDVKVNGTPTVTVVDNGGGLTVGPVTNDGKNDDGYYQFSFAVLTPSTISPANIEITGIKLDVDDDAAFGDVKIKIAGEATTETLVLGSIKGYGYNLSVENVIKVMAGDDKEELEDIILEEEIDATIIGNGRTIKFKLPENVAWLNQPSVKVDKGNGLALTALAGSVSTDRRTATYTFTGGDFSNTAMKFLFEGGEIAVKASASAGDVILTVDGSSNVAGELKIAEIVKPVVITASQMDVQVGKQGQPVGDILIKEVKAGYLKADRTIVIGFDKADTAKFATTPVVEVVEGDMKIDTVTKKDGYIEITIDRVSTEVSTIKISGIKVDLDRTPAEGEYKFKVYGTAINRVHQAGIASGASSDAIAVISKDALDTSATNGLSFAAMTVTTPAQDGVVKPVVMTVGSTVYTIGGVEMTMDVAPYIRDSRTYFPVRHVAQALGITTDNVVWDNAQRTVTIFRGNRIVQVTIGSKTMLVNGVPLTMDVAPEITADRTMLPIRFVAQGLGVNVDWDDATRTITLN